MDVLKYWLVGWLPSPTNQLPSCRWLCFVSTDHLFCFRCCSRRNGDMPIYAYKVGPYRGYNFSYPFTKPFTGVITPFITIVSCRLPKGKAPVKLKPFTYEKTRGVSGQDLSELPTMLQVPRVSRRVWDLFCMWQFLKRCRGENLNWYTR